MAKKKTHKSNNTISTKVSSSQFESHPLLTDSYPDWIEPLPVNMVNARLMRIIQFYVFNSPCEHSSWGRKTMESHGWVNYWNSSNFRSLIFDSAELNEFHQCSSLTDFAKKWSDTYSSNENYYSNQDEYAYYIKAGEESILINLFHRIRNSFCHGRFRMNGEYFFFEDGVLEDKLFKVKARICLKMDTLEKWMSIIECKNDESRLLQENMKRNQKRKVNSKTVESKFEEARILQPV